MDMKEFEEKVDEFIKSFTKEEMIKILKENGFEVIENEEQGKWKPQYGERYWYRDDAGWFRSDEYEPGDVMEWRFAYVPVFQTKEECEKYWEFRDALKEKRYEFSDEEFDDIDITKFYIEYSHGDKNVYVANTWHYKSLGMIYFKTREDAHYIIDNYREELLKYWL